MESIKKYVDHFNAASLDMHFEVEESLSDKARAEEYIMMRLRLSDGLSLSEYEIKFGAPLDHRYIERMAPFIASGHVRNENGVYHLTPDGMYVSNYILSEILDLD